MLRRVRNILPFHPTLSTQNSKKRPELKGSQTVKTEVCALTYGPTATSKSENIHTEFRASGSHGLHIGIRFDSAFSPSVRSTIVFMASAFMEKLIVYLVEMMPNVHRPYALVASQTRQILAAR